MQMPGQTLIKPSVIGAPEFYEARVTVLLGCKRNLALWHLIRASYKRTVNELTPVPTTCRPV